MGTTYNVLRTFAVKAMPDSGLDRIWPGHGNWFNVKHFGYGIYHPERSLLVISK